jgi:hypothetical protein
LSVSIDFFARKESGKKAELRLTVHVKIPFPLPPSKEVIYLIVVFGDGWILESPLPG